LIARYFATVGKVKARGSAFANGHEAREEGPWPVGACYVVF